jgi:hypothetical protein
MILAPGVVKQQRITEKASKLDFCETLEENFPFQIFPDEPSLGKHFCHILYGPGANVIKLFTSVI